MVSALPQNVSYKEIMAKLVCSLESCDCMLHRCPQCPGTDNLKSYLELIFDQADTDFDDTLQYKQWIHDEQTTLQSVSSTIQSFIDSLCSSADKATDHQFIAKSQASYLRSCKDNLRPNESALILLDFAENYSLVCQDAVQGFHWETSQATLHPFVVYYREEVGGELKSLSVCIISDDREHVTGTVHAFQKAMLEKVKLHLPQVKNIIYFSDGAAGQYKNCKNFINLCFHEKDFGVKAEWNFFATSHGKSPCDGVGGTVKRLVARASLQATTSDHILTPLEMYTWC